MKMTEEEILSVYNQGPEAVIKLVRGLLSVIYKLSEIIDSQNKKIESLGKRTQELESKINKVSLFKTPSVRN